METKIFTRQTTYYQEQSKSKQTSLIEMGLGLMCLFCAVGSIREGSWLGIIFFLFLSLFYFLIAYCDYSGRKKLKVVEVQCDEEGIRFIYEKPGPVFFVEWKQVSEIAIYSSNNGVDPNPYDWGSIVVLGYFLLEDGTREYGTVSLPHSKYKASDGLYLSTFWEEYEGSKDKVKKENQ